MVETTDDVKPLNFKQDSFIINDSYLNETYILFQTNVFLIDAVSCSNGVAVPCKTLLKKGIF